MRQLLPLLLLTACSGGDETTPAAPSLVILEPADGATVAAGDVPVSVVVSDFGLVDPDTQARRFDPTRWLPLSSAWAHGDEAATGWLELELDGADAGTLGETQGTLGGVAVDEHVLLIRLIHSDGEPVEPLVEVTSTFTAE